MDIFASIRDLCGATVVHVQDRVAVAGAAFHQACAAQPAEHADTHPLIVGLGAAVPAFVSHIPADELVGAAHKLGSALASIDFHKIADDVRRQMEEKAGPLDAQKIFLLGLAVVAGIVAARVLTSVVVYVGLPALGFTGKGVAAGSIAAAWQSTLGSVAAGSLFATLQSVGAVGLRAGLVAGTVVGIGAVVGAAAHAAHDRKL